MVPVEGDVRREVLVSLRRQHGFVAGLRSRLRSFLLFFFGFFSLRSMSRPFRELLARDRVEDPKFRLLRF